MKKIMFYSYKGGSGRTVAAANVAAAFVKFGLKTAIVDLDFEAPGLHHVFEKVTRTDQYKRGFGIQHYLRGDKSLDEVFGEIAIDLLKLPPYDMWRAPSDEHLTYIMASPKVANINSTDPNVVDRMTDLLRRLESRGTDVVIIDAASGIRDSYSIAADVSSEMLILFRWTTQHVEGTLQMVRYQKRLKEYERSIPYKLVASASPSQEEINRISDETERNLLLSLKDEITRRIEQTLEDCGAPFAHIFDEIPEMVRLKWKESITVFDHDESPYERLARRLIESV